MRRRLRRGSRSRGEHVPDVILMDLRLPDMDGAEATRRLAADERTARIPVVAMSASPLEGRDDWLEEAGFAGWLEKPIHVSTFPEQVRRYCAERRVTRSRAYRASTPTEARLAR